MEPGCQAETHQKVVVVQSGRTDAEVILAEIAFIELAGIEECDGGLRSWPATNDDAAELCARLASWSPAVERVAQRNWNEAWQSGWQPIEVGERFYLVPPGDASVTPGGRIRLQMYAGTAFGNGDHATTHLCLMAMERALRPGDAFLDIGCGSGLLGEAARGLGASHVWGCDIDPAVVRGRGAFTGSVDAVRSATCDFVIANIQLGVLETLLPDIARVSRPGGRVVLSGILEDQVSALRAAVSSVGLEPGEASFLNGWAALGAPVKA